ncbi:MAG: type III-B CRISPR module-associated Cmr3 family protein [Gammaproteobacteria bacterium]
MTTYLALTPRDPLIARDGRPLGAGQGLRMKSLDWPYPSVLAGSLRSLLGKLKGGEFAEGTVKALQEIEVAGPLPLLGDQLYFPAPKDLVVFEDEAKNRKIIRLRPMELKDGAGCNLPSAQLWPVAVSQDVKPAKTPAFWSSAQMTRWLLDQEVVPPERGEYGSGFLDAPAKDERMHVSIDPDSYAAKKGLLFMTVGLDMNFQGRASPLSLAARIEANDQWRGMLRKLDAFHPLGGERRLARWRAEASHTWDCAGELRTAFRKASHVRLILATPAIFNDGWKPAWLDKTALEGGPPGTSVCLKLVGACVERWKPISGWSLVNRQVGPKQLRRLVPAGSVYFFEVIRGEALELIDRLWLRSVADDIQDRRDGFGLALWGIWNKDQGGVRR